ncbi:hypothetical protein DWB61_10920 [Ancylomarina euxinus]|uniref:J domain-containing protein n=1 Tax=Ancylomarina euxinus TaxID=2283627 RepID=A0A425XZN2_9BACT|nr:hypothetical protein [Ancylomarina euxinus]MCZ4695436.1 hypothetical protein [Ancylomarina euxinus]MUP15632.1 hypothetical protein [Ancylomarina euxinus]RRG20929.1 hypothetical protein DWB61_10920 [Ancylomarina euxinus]
MFKQNLPNTKNSIQEQLSLKAQIQALKGELQAIEHETSVFEASLRAILIDMIIEEQELSDLYRRMQKAKKQKRLEQKKRGKNYIDPIGIKSIPKQKIVATESKEVEKEKKRLYREAMLHVHPDKFSMNEDKVDLATEVTSKLIEIYKTGNLRELELFHAHIFSGNALLQTEDADRAHSGSAIEDSYLKQEKEALEQQLILAKNRQTYRVLKDYENPMHFAEELRLYYTDRLFKLRKRTRKA